jgi:hypothetical protein
MPVPGNRLAETPRFDAVQGGEVTSRALDATIEREQWDF